VFVYMPPNTTWSEVQLEDERYDHRTQAKERLLKGRPFVCAIFHWIPPGMYTVRCKSVKLEAEVEVRAGVLSQVDWRKTLVG
jgi:hypothetical protein